MKPQERIFVNAVEAAKLLCMGRTSFFTKVRQGLLPQPYRGIGAPKWRVSDLQQISAPPATPTTTP